MYLTPNQQALWQHAKRFRRLANDSPESYPLRQRLIKHANDIDRQLAKEIAENPNDAN